MLVLALVLGACSGGDDDGPVGDAATTTTRDAAAESVATTAVAGSTTDVAGSTTVDTVEIAATVDSAPEDPPVTLVTVPPSLATIPEVGVPGLDSEVAFCAAWSRFGGTFQVVAVSAAFGSTDAADLAALEVVAAPAAVGAYTEMLAEWPAELADERAAVDDDRFGPYARRWQAALDALTSVGADTATLDVLVAAWVDALAARDPSTPDVTVDLPDEVWAVVDAAAAEFAAARVPFQQDPSLGSTVATPATDAYLATTCPDQGTLTGVDP